VALVPLGPEGATEVLNLCSEIGDLHGWPLWGYVHDADTFCDAMTGDRALAFTVVRRDDTPAIGLVRACEIDHHQGTASIEVLLDPEHWRSGWALEGVLLLIDLLFTEPTIHKLYFEVGDRVLGRMRSAVGPWLDEEARLREHLYVAGRHQDLVVLGLSRDRWHDGIRPRLGSLLGAEVRPLEGR
jgi:RimJ/RimL family protein N-acetyltransferase